jgi:hypothetical protein
MVNKNVLSALWTEFRRTLGIFVVVEIPYNQQQMYITLDEEFKTNESKKSQPSDSKQLKPPF